MSHHNICDIAKTLIKDIGNDSDKVIVFSEWLHKRAFKVKPSGRWYALPEYIVSASLVDEDRTVNDGNCVQLVNTLLALAKSQGIRGREVCLAHSDGYNLHSVAEVFLDNHWTIVDPLLDIIPHRDSGKPVSAVEIQKNPEVLKNVKNTEIWSSQLNHKGYGEFFQNISTKTEIKNYKNFTGGVFDAKWIDGQEKKYSLIFKLAHKTKNSFFIFLEQISLYSRRSGLFLRNHKK